MHSFFLYFYLLFTSLFISLSLNANNQRTLHILSDESGLSPSTPKDPSIIDEKIYKAWEKSCVIAEITIQNEIDRYTITEIGLVIDNSGNIVLRAEALPTWIPLSRIQNVTIHPFNIETKENGFKATFIGKDSKTKWNYIKADPAALQYLTPIDSFPSTLPSITQTLYGFNFLGKEFNFQPLITHSQLAGIIEVPFKIGILTDPKIHLGSPVFTNNNQFAGWITRSSSQQFFLNMRPEETLHVSLMLKEYGDQLITPSFFYKRVLKNPELNIIKRKSWLGVYGLSAINKNTAELLELNNQSGITIGKIIENSSAQKANLQEQDIILAVNNTPLIYHNSENVIITDFFEHLNDFNPNDSISLTLLRDNKLINVDCILAADPKTEYEAEYYYFNELGFTLREGLVIDNLSMQNFTTDISGNRVVFVRPSSKASISNLLPGDYILEVDQTPVNTLSKAIEIINQAIKEKSSPSLILLINRNNQNQILQIKLD